MGFLSRFVIRFRNARKVITQIKTGEWAVPESEIDGVIYTAQRDGRVLWLANGAFFCDLKSPNGNKDLMAFGLLWRHWVWWAAARKLKSGAERKTLVKFNPPEL